MALIQKDEVLRYLGYRGGALDDETNSALDRAMDLVTRTASPRVAQATYPLTRREGLIVEGTSLVLEGEAVKGLLRESDRVILFCVTLGNEIEQLLRAWQVKDMAFATMLDACGSSGVEVLCDRLEQELTARHEAQGFYLTPRFSPGYEDMPISQQRALCDVLDTQRKIGVTLSAGCMLIPRKSVTALMGIAPCPQRRETRCEGCVLYETCRFRREGTACVGQIV